MAVPAADSGLAGSNEPDASDRRSHFFHGTGVQQLGECKQEAEERLWFACPDLVSLQSISGTMRLTLTAQTCIESAVHGWPETEGERLPSALVFY